MAGIQSRDQKEMYRNFTATSPPPQHWQGTEYTDSANPTDLQPDQHTPVWCADLPLLRIRSAAA